MDRIHPRARRRKSRSSSSPRRFSCTHESTSPVLESESLHQGANLLISSASWSAGYGLDSPADRVRPGARRPWEDHPARPDPRHRRRGPRGRWDHAAHRRHGGAPRGDPRGVRRPRQGQDVPHPGAALHRHARPRGVLDAPRTPFLASYSDQPESAREELDKRMYELVGRLYEHGFSADRYDRIEDFTTNLAVVPVSAKHGEGIADMLLMLIGLAQRFLEPQLETAAGPAEGTILEVKEEKGLGVTLDAIIYQGVLAKGDTVVFGTTGKAGTTKVKALLKPKPLDEIRDPQERFDSVATAT